MKYEFPIMIQNNCLPKKRIGLIFALLCFILSFILMILYSAHYAFSLMVPIVYLIVRIKVVFSEKQQMIQGIITMIFFEKNLSCSIITNEKKSEIQYVLDYLSIKSYLIENKRVAIHYYSYKKHGKKDKYEIKSLEFFCDEDNQRKILAELDEHV